MTAAQTPETGKGRRLLRLLADVANRRPAVGDALQYGTADGKDDGRWHPRPLPDRVIHELPAGGNGGQVLTKTSSADYAIDWETPTAGASSPIESVNTVPDSGAALTLPDVFDATMHRVTLTADCALAFPDPVAGKSFSLWLVQDGTGSRTVTWDAAADWGGSSAPTLSTAAGAVDVFGWACSDGASWTNLGYVLDSS